MGKQALLGLGYETGNLFVHPMETVTTKREENVVVDTMSYCTNNMNNTSRTNEKCSDGYSPIL